MNEIIRFLIVTSIPETHRSITSGISPLENTEPNGSLSILDSFLQFYRRCNPLLLDVGDEQFELLIANG
jgi:hypothetical protein